VVGSEAGLESLRFAKIFHNTSVEFPLQASASDGYFSKYEWSYGKWARFFDELGEADIPLLQIYDAESEHYRYQIVFESELAQYFRAPVMLEKHLKLRVFSDFRAVGVKTHVLIQRKPMGTDKSGTTVYNGTVDTMNALEFAYESPVDVALFKQQRKMA